MSGSRIPDMEREYSILKSSRTNMKKRAMHNNNNIYTK